MEEEKAAALYEEVTKKGQSAARFKHGLGFSFTNSSSSSSSSNENVTFVKASSDNTYHHNTNTNTNTKQTQLQSIHNKLTLTKKYRDIDIHRDHRDRDHSRDRRHKRRSSSRDRERRRRRSMSRSDSDGERKQRRSVSRSPERKRGDATREKRKSVGINYAKLIRGYEKMSPAERIKAKMKYQLSETAEKDAMNGMGSGWERFEFDKDAPLDDEEMEVADDDVALVKHIGQSFRFSAVEANWDDKIKAAHDEAMFGSSRVLSPIHTEDIMEQKHESKSKESASATSLLSDKVIAGQQGSWRDRARKG